MLGNEFYFSPESWALSFGLARNNIVLEAQLAPGEKRLGCIPADVDWDVKHQHKQTKAS